MPVAKKPKLNRVQIVSADVVQTIASRMLDPMPPLVGYFAFAGELYRRTC